MGASTGPRHDTYDVIVIGSGLGGITAGALLARAGRKVLVVERQDGPGGYAHAFRRGPYTFDPAIHVIGEGEVVESLLAYLGVGDRCRLTVGDDFYRVILPDLSLRTPFGFEAFIEAHLREFPHEAQSIRRFAALLAQFYLEATQLPMELGLGDLDRAAERFPLFFRYRTATLGAVLDDYLTDPRAKATLAAIWPYLGLPPSRVAFLASALFLRVLLDGAYSCRGGVQELVDAFVAALGQHGGELVVGTQVSRIVVEAGRATGVTLANGRQVRAPVVIANADARHTLEELVGAEQLPAPLISRLRRMKPSLSAFVVYAATTLDLRPFEPVHETFVYKHWDHDATYRDILRGEPGGMWASIPTLTDPSVAPPGEHLIIFSALAPYDIGAPWEREQARYREGLLSQIEALFPGFRDHLAHVEVATPLTLERYTLNHQGAIYGWENTPAQTGSKRLSHQTPIGGLYLSGHWTQEGPSSFRVILSGINTAHLVLAEVGLEDPIPDFRPPDVPPAQYPAMPVSRG